MSASKWIQIIVGEFQTGHRSGLLYREIIQNLQEDRFDPIYVTRANKGIGETNDIRIPVHESIQFNNLPMIIETVGSEEQVDRLIPKLKDKISSGELVTLTAFSLNERTTPEQEDEYLMLKLFLHEKAPWRGHPKHEEILFLLQEHRMIWSIVKDGIAGFGKERLIRKPSLFSGSRVPVVLECVGKQKDIRKLIPELKSKIDHGLIIVMPVQVILCQ